MWWWTFFYSTSVAFQGPFVFSIGRHIFRRGCRDLEVGYGSVICGYLILEFREYSVQSLFLYLAPALGYVFHRFTPCFGACPTPGLVDQLGCVDLLPEDVVLLLLQFGGIPRFPFGMLGFVANSLLLEFDDLSRQKIVDQLKLFLATLSLQKGHVELCGSLGLLGFRPAGNGGEGCAA